jgi:hypothetical protein
MGWRRGQGDDFSLCFYDHPFDAFARSVVETVRRSTCLASSNDNSANTPLQPIAVRVQPAFE